MPDHVETDISCAMCDTDADLVKCANCGDIMCRECLGDGDCEGGDI